EGGGAPAQKIRANQVWYPSVDHRLPGSAFGALRRTFPPEAHALFRYHRIPVLSFWDNLYPEGDRRKNVCAVCAGGSCKTCHYRSAAFLSGPRRGGHRHPTVPHRLFGRAPFIAVGIKKRLPYFGEDRLCRRTIHYHNAGPLSHCSLNRACLLYSPRKVTH